MQNGGTAASQMGMTLDSAVRVRLSLHVATTKPSTGKRLDMVIEI
jgi:hypothetical protein